MHMQTLDLNRGTFCKQAAGLLLASACMLTGPTASPAAAAVGEGDLPDGAMAFSKVLKFQKDWAKVAETVRSRGTEMDDREKLNTKFFLKQLANEYYDMELLSKGILNPERAAQAKAIAKDFRQKVRECDDALDDGNVNKILDNYPGTSAELDEFLSLLQDVPDEL